MRLSMNVSGDSTLPMRLSNLDTAALLTSLDFSTAIARPFSEAWRSCKMATRLGRPTKREKKGWPTFLFVPLSRTRRSLLESRRSMHRRRSRSRKLSLDQSLAYTNRSGTSATWLSCQRSRRGTTPETTSPGPTQGPQNAAFGRTCLPRSAVSDYRGLPRRFHELARSHRQHRHQTQGIPGAFVSHWPTLHALCQKSSRPRFPQRCPWRDLSARPLRSQTKPRPPELGPQPRYQSVRLRQHRVLVADPWPTCLSPRTSNAALVRWRRQQRQQSLRLQVSPGTARRPPWPGTPGGPLPALLLQIQRD